MTASFGRLLEDALNMPPESIIELYSDSRLSLIGAFVFLIPFWSVVLVVNLIGEMRPLTRAFLRVFNDYSVCVLAANVSYNTYYFSTKGILTMHGRMHMVAALCCLLFIIFLAFRYKPSSDVMYGIMISYIGISLSLFTLPLEYFPLESKILSTFYLLGLIIYFFGLVMTAIAARFGRFARRWFRGE